MKRKSLHILFILLMLANIVIEANGQTQLIRLFFRSSAPKAVRTVGATTVRSVEYNTISKTLYEVSYSPELKSSGTSLEQFIERNSFFSDGSSYMPLKEALKKDLISKDAGNAAINSSKGSVVTFNENYTTGYRRFFKLENSNYVTNKSYEETLMATVKRFQTEHGLAADGIIDGKTATIVHEKIYEQYLVDRQLLKKYFTTTERRRAIEVFQGMNELPVTGTFNQATRKLLDKECFPTHVYFYDFSIQTVGRFERLPFDYAPVKWMESLGYLNKNAPLAEETKQIISFQRRYRITPTGNYNDATKRQLQELIEIDQLIPSSVKKGKRFDAYKEKYLRGIQQEHKLEVTGLLDDQTRSTLIQLSDKRKIRLLQERPGLHDNYVNPNLLFEQENSDVKLYFSDEGSDYFIIANSKFIPKDNPAKIGWRLDRQTNNIEQLPIDELVKKFEEASLNNVKEHAQPVNLLFIGFADESGNHTIQFNKNPITITKSEMNEFIENGPAPPALDELVNAAPDLPMILLRPTGMEETSENYLYKNIWGSQYSAINTAKFAAALNRTYGVKTPVYLGTSIVDAVKKLPQVVTNSKNTSFEFFIPSKAFSKEIDDYNLIRNLSARGLKRSYFRDQYALVPSPRVKSTKNAKGTIFVGHKNEFFKRFVRFGAAKSGDGPLMVFSCYLPGDENFISQLIFNHKNTPYVIHFSEIIHPTVCTDVLLAFFTIRKEIYNADKPIYQLLLDAADLVRKGNALRYSPNMIKELDKLQYSIIIQIVCTRLIIQTQNA